ncbi:MAG TPA: CehA/McbA family metallohydrolase [Draconibacterium sp.]|nr:CehA/McbA family metallohydrolase [Draconibacterium sp.]
MATNNILLKSFAIAIFAIFITISVQAQSTGIVLQVDGAKMVQKIDGFGVNINAAWWFDGEYGDNKIVQPAIDMLIDSLGATIFRTVIEEMDWEAFNDDNDPNNFNWNYYNKVFSDNKFQGIWKTLAYLNEKGITDGLILSLMGGPPAAAPLTEKDKQKSWMGGTDYTISPAMEDEFVESIAAFLYYARYTAKIQFKLVSPMNETDIISLTKNADHPDGIVEGPDISDAVQFTRIVKKLAEKLDAIGMNDIRFVTPDAGGEKLFASCLGEMAKDFYLMGKLAHWGVHNYGSNAKNYMSTVNKPANPNKSLWVTEMAGITNLFGQLEDNAGAYIFWDGFDCVYQHARRNGYGGNPPNDWVFWQPTDGKPLLEYLPSSKSWIPRKQFYQFTQVFKFVKAGAIKLSTLSNNGSLVAYAFLNPNGQLVIVGQNSGKQAISFDGKLTNLPAFSRFEISYTDTENNLQKNADVIVVNNKMRVIVPPESVFTLTGSADPELNGISEIKPGPSSWYAGDMHVHRNCGIERPILPESEFVNMMRTNNLAVISVLADMGNAEVQDSQTDLPKVNGTDAPQSIPGRIVHYDAEWHFDPEGVTFDHKAIGGHLVFLGLQNARQIWDESPYKILEWGRSQNAVQGFCHMQYLNDTIQDELTCCIPLEYPVETALGTIDFLAEDVWLNDAAVKGYYRLLNCGFRLGWAAGTDYPCNNSEPLGSLLTYVDVNKKPLTYSNWIEGIKNGRTVVTTNGHVEFLDLKINGSSSPGDEIKLNGKGFADIDVTWTTIKELSGTIEIVCNGAVVESKKCSAKQGEPVTLKASIPVTKSSWICARRIDELGHRSHTAPVYITINNAPVRASAEDAKYFISWIDNLLEKTSPGGPWNGYFTHDLDVVQDRYRKAKAIYEKIEIEAEKVQKLQ